MNGTMIASLIPSYCCSDTLSVIEIDQIDRGLFLLSMLNSLTFDFFSRQKVGGTHFSHWILKQLPVVDREREISKNCRILLKIKLSACLIRPLI